MQADVQTGRLRSEASGTGSAGTNYGQSDFGYDVMNRRVRVRSPGRTITRTVYDARGRVASVWVGTDDEPTGGEWSPGNLTGTDMKSGCPKGEDDLPHEPARPTRSH
jgi:YD repeat-containing protein